MPEHYLTRAEYGAILQAVQRLNETLAAILTNPACPRCRSHFRQGRHCGTCGENLFPPKDK